MIAANDAYRSLLIGYGALAIIAFALSDAPCSRFFLSIARDRALHSLLYLAMRSFFSYASMRLRSSSLRRLISGRFS